MEQRTLSRLLATDAPAATVLIRLSVGLVFLPKESKYLFAAELGVGRFAKIGLPAPQLLAPLVGATEIVCGGAILLGILTRVAAVPLTVIMLVAIASTKIPILLSQGIWAMAHEARTDGAMLCGALFLLLVGAGPWSIDGRLRRDRRAR